MNTEKENPRRNFFQKAIALAAGVALTTVGGKKALAASPEKIKMLTPDGKLVEVDSSAIIDEGCNGRATNQEVMNWMNKKK